jgi:hypothetical protein
VEAIMEMVCACILKTLMKTMAIMDMATMISSRVKPVF